MLTSFSKGVAGGVLDTAQSMQQHVEGQSNQDESDTAKGEPA
jgi:hypothetical protein